MLLPAVYLVLFLALTLVVGWPSPSTILFLAINTLIVGFSEELAFRGVLFRGLHTRIAQLREHHVARLAEVEAACVSPCSAMDIVPLMFRRPLDAHQLTFALGEALAHLHALWAQGIVLRRFDADGIIRFVRP